MSSSLVLPAGGLRGTNFGGEGAESPFTDAEVDEYARTYSRPQVSEGLLESTSVRLEPLVVDSSRSVEVPGSGHWLPEENPEVVTTELLDFLADGR